MLFRSASDKIFRWDSGKAQEWMIASVEVSMTEERRKNINGRRSGEDRRKGRSALYTGPERRAVDRRSGVGRRAT